LEQDWGKMKKDTSFDYTKMMKKSTESIMEQSNLPPINPAK